MEVSYNTLNDFADEIKVLILSYLTKKDKLVMECVSRHFRQLLEDRTAFGSFNTFKDKRMRFRNLCEEVSKGKKKEHNLMPRFSSLKIRPLTIAFSRHGNEGAFSLDRNSENLSSHWRYFYTYPNLKSYDLDDINFKGIGKVAFHWVKGSFFSFSRLDLFQLQFSKDEYSIESFEIGIHSNIDGARIAIETNLKISLIDLNSFEQKIIVDNPYEGFNLQIDEDSKISHLFLKKERVVVVYAQSQNHFQFVRVYSSKEGRALSTTILTTPYKESNMKYQVAGNRLACLSYQTAAESSDYFCTSMELLDLTTQEISILDWPAPVYKESTVHLKKNYCLVYGKKQLLSYNFATKKFTDIAGSFLHIRTPKIISNNTLAAITQEKDYCKINIYHLANFKLLASDFLPGTFCDEPYPSAIYYKSSSSFSLLALLVPWGIFTVYSNERSS